MKLFHISDLHLGKRLHDYSLIEDQAFILDRIIELAKNNKPDGIIIAGDVYDKPVPTAEAVALFDFFLSELSELDIKAFVISGNHDSPERIAFGSELMHSSGIYMSPVYDGSCKPIVMADEYGDVNIYLLPFIKPAHVRRYFPDANIESYTDALMTAVNSLNIDAKQRNIIVTHQFITGASRSDSEEITVGGSDNVDIFVFDKFDYVALGHIHSPQNIGKDTVRYSGTPLKYSFSEVSHEKSVTVIDVAAKGEITVSALALKPLRDLREIKGTYSELTNRENYIYTNTDDYLRIILTDEDDIPDASAKLQTIYPNLMNLDYDNTRTRAVGSFASDEVQQMLSPIEYFAELYEKQNGAPMDEKQSEYIGELIERLAGEEA